MNEQLFMANQFFEDDDNGQVYSGIDEESPPGKSFGKVTKDMNYYRVCVKYINKRG